MNRAWRVFYGATLGALVVLLIHPASRPYFLTPLSHWGASQSLNSSPLLLQNYKVLPKPASLGDAALYMEDGAVMLSEKAKITSRELDTLLGVAQNAARQDADNAYWEEMEAVFLNAESRLPKTDARQASALREKALEAWKRASTLDRWEDYQTRRLKVLQNNLAAETGGTASWQYAAVYPLRHPEPAQAICEFAREVTRNLDLVKPASLLLRYQTMMNGKLLREGSRSVAIGQLGSDMVESSYYPKPAEGKITPKIHIIARTEFYNKLAALGRTASDPKLRTECALDAGKVNDVFNSNDAWLAFSQRDDVATHTQALRIGSLMTISIPGALLAISLFGGMLWTLSALLRAQPQLLKIVEPPIAPALGLALAVLLYRATELPLASIAVVACFGFLAFTPVHERSHPPEQLGPVFELTLFTLSCVLVMLGIAFFVGLSTPGSQVLPDLGTPREFYGGSTLLLGLCGIVLGLLLLAAPCWAMVQRISTPAVVVLALRQFGRGLLLGCLAIAIVLTPLCILADKGLQSDLNKIVLDEPRYYQLND